MERRNPNLYRLEEAILDCNRAALEASRPWAWRRFLDGLPPSPRPEPVTRPGWPFNLSIRLDSGRLRVVHEPTDPSAEAAALLARLPVERAEALAVVGFGAGYVVEAALAVAPTGCSVIAAVVDPVAFGVTLAWRDLSATLADPRLILAVGDAAELRAALPKPSVHLVWVVHPPVLSVANPALAAFADPRPAPRLDYVPPFAPADAEDPDDPS